MTVRSIILALVLCCVAAPSFAEIGRVKTAVGAAYIERDGKRLTANPGTLLEQGDILVTGDGGRLAVTFIDNSRFSAGPFSRVSVDRFEFNTTTHKGRFETRVMQGSLAIVSGQIAKETRDAMKVRTPSAILGVRGTRFIVAVDE